MGNEDKKRTVNVRPFHCEFAGNTSGFTLTFFDRTESGQERRFVLHFDFWWVRFLAGNLWQAIQYRRSAVVEAEIAMKEQRNG